MSKEFKRKILVDEPTSSDNFIGQSHDRTANALAEAIYDFSEADRSIGLEGSWGSGKSSVVDIANEKLKGFKDKKFKSFTYDLWANSEVSFKRAFLESFLGWIQKEGLAEQVFIKEQENIIRDRTRRISTDGFRHYNWFGIFLLFLIPLLPLFYVWLSPLAYSNAIQDIWLAKYSAYIAIVIVLIVGLLYKIRLFQLYKSAKNKNHITHPFKEALNRSLSLFTNDVNEVTITQNIRDEDPTQYEFHNIFRKILSKLQANDNRVIIVFDNIDRLNSEQIPKVWSEVRSVFSEDQSKLRPDDSYITAVVPYDRKHVLDSFFKNNGNPNDAENTKDKMGFLKEDIFRKSFDAIFYVAPPITSDTSAFFKDKLIEALGLIVKDTTQFRLFKLYDTYLHLIDEKPTPRQIISFINELSALWVQWENEIPLESIGVYVLYRHKIEENPKILRDPELIDPLLMEYTQKSELLKHLAALAYNIKPDLAYQILFLSAVKNAFILSTSEELVKISGTPGFEENLPDIIRENAPIWANSDATNLGNAIRNFSDINLNIAAQQNCINHFSKAFKHLKKLDLSEWEKHQNIFYIFEHLSKEASVEVVEKLTFWFSESVQEEAHRSFDAGQYWVNIIGAMVKELSSRHNDAEFISSVKKNIKIPETPDFLLGVANDCKLAGTKFTDFSKINDIASISEQLDEYVVNYGENFQDIWPQLETIIQEKDKGRYLETLSEHIQNNLLEDENERSIVFDNFIKIYHSIKNTEDQSNTIETLIKSGSLYWHADQEENYECLASILWILAINIGTNELPTITTNPHPIFGDLGASRNSLLALYKGNGISEEILDKLTDYSISKAKISKIIEFAASEAEDSQLFNPLLKKIVSHPSFYGPHLTTIINHFDFIQETLSKDIEIILSKVGSQNYLDKISNFDITSLPPSLIKSIANRKENEWKKLNTKIDDYLKTTNQDEWIIELKTPSIRLTMLSERIKVSNLHIPVSNLKQPLKDYIYSILADETNSFVFEEKLDFIVNSLPKSNREKLPNEILSELDGKSVTVKGLENLLLSFTKFVNNLPFEKYPDTTVAKILTALCQSKNEIIKDFLEDNKETFKQAIKSATKDNQIILKETFEGMFITESADEIEWLKQLGKSLGVKIPKKKIIEPPKNENSE